MNGSCAIALLAVFPGDVSADGDGSAARRVAIAVRTATPPVIDGRLDDAAWDAAPPIGELVQIEPVAGAAPSERTEIRVLYDDEHLYLGVRCFDRDRDGIIGTQMARDAVLDPDDRVEIVIDTYLDRRNAYFFQMGPVGSKGDALISNNGQDFNKPWDGIWEGKSSIDALGWSFEMALPFQTLSFRPDTDTWGLNVNRWIKRRNEEARWNNAQNDVSVFQIAEAGDLSGLSGLKQGIGVDVVPFFHADWTNPRGGDADVLGTPGLDVFYRITPSLQASFTLNTDFAETEVDERRVNLTRFPLFFPEKRDFFLQDSGIFEFADQGDELVALPFFSRRIGLDEQGREVPIRYGAKLTGRHEGWNIGALAVHTGAGDTSGSNEQDLVVTRLSHNVGEQSTLGGIVTAGNPAGGPDNAVFGLDWNYRTRQFLGDRNLTSSVWALRSETQDASGDEAFGASVESRGDLWTWSLGANEVGEDFDARLGFVPRRQIRSYSAELVHAPRPTDESDPVRRYRQRISLDAVTNLDDHLESGIVELQPFGIELDSGDELYVSVLQSREDLTRDFDIRSDVTIPAGTYDFTRGRIELLSALKRPLSLESSFEAGEFFDGTREDYSIALSWRPSRFFNGSLGYDQNHVELPDGSFTTHLGRVRANISFSPDVDWFHFVQFDDDSDSLGWNSRLRWILNPGEELFVVWNQTLERDGDALVSTFQEAAFKLGYTLRF